MNLRNPFENPEIAAVYKGWYFTKGKKTADAEKALLKSIIFRLSGGMPLPYLFKSTHSILLL
jgi:hypothetical protein